jgi:hypothetical protein
MVYFVKKIQQVNSRFDVACYILRIWQAIFIALEVNHQRNWDWGLVLLPVWLYLALEIYNTRFINAWGNSISQGLNEEAIMMGVDKDPEHQTRYQQGQQLKGMAMWNMIFTIGPIIMSVLLVCRLEVRFISTFLIIIPIFIAFGCCCCGTVCGLMCMANLDLGDQSGQEEPSPSTHNPAFESKSTSEDMSKPILEGSSTAQYGSTDAVQSQPSSYQPVVIPDATESNTASDAGKVETAKANDAVDID